MAHKLNKKNQHWRDMVDAGLVPPLTEKELCFVDYDFWQREDAGSPVRCPTATRPGREAGSALKSTGKLMKKGKRYVVVVTTDGCVPLEAGALRNGIRQDPPVTINLTNFGPRTVPRHSTTTFTPSR
jgi:hypothetical protein